MKLLDEIMAEEYTSAEWAAIWQARIDALEADLRAADDRAVLMKREIDQLRAALAAANADRDAVLAANAALNQELRAASGAPVDRLSTHWAGCWRDGGRRHWQCAAAVAEQQTARADAAEAKLAAVPVDALWRLYNDFPYLDSPMADTFAVVFEWLARQTGSEVQP